MRNKCVSGNGRRGKRRFRRPRRCRWRSRAGAGGFLRVLRRRAMFAVADFGNPRSASPVAANIFEIFLKGGRRGVKGARFRWGNFAGGTVSFPPGIRDPLRSGLAPRSRQLLAKLLQRTKNLYTPTASPVPAFSYVIYTL